MIVKRSLLELKDFFITSYNYSFEHPTNKLEVLRWFEEYEIDMDFGIVDLEDKLHQVALKVKINKGEKQLPGYVIETECIGIFYLSDSNITEEFKQNLLVRSALMMNINYVRTFIAGNTSNYPLGKYWLPSVNVPNLISRKSLRIEDSDLKEQETVVKRKKKIKNENKSKA